MAFINVNRDMVSYETSPLGVAKGAFAEYIAADWDLTGLVPENVGQ